MTLEEENFARLWAGRARRVIVLDVPEAARRDLMRFMPINDLPARLQDGDIVPSDPATVTTKDEAPAAIDRRGLVWSFIREAPGLSPGGARVGEATAAVTPVAASGAGVRAPLRPVAAETPDRR